MIQQEKAIPPHRPKPEKLIEVPIYNGQETATLTREVDPQGAIVEHRVKKSSYAHEKMHDKGTIDDELYDAAERFRMDFGRAHLDGKFATIDMFKVRGASVPHVTDAVVAAKEAVRVALSSLGERKASNGFSLSKSCVWFVIGCGHTLEDWSLRIRTGGGSMTSDRASGLLLGCLEKLAFHYGLLRLADIKQRAQQKTWKDAKAMGKREECTDLLNRLTLMKTTRDPQKALEEFERLLQQRVAQTTSAE